jgi:RNA polymerase sigma-70 factor (ECF subfamily)
MPTPDTTLGALPAPPRDRDLVARIAERNESALAMLYERFSGTIYALCLRILGASGDAEDVLQETFLQVWRQASRYDPTRSSVSSWLILIARSRAIDRLRSRRVAERAAVEAAVESSVSGPPEDASPEGVRNVFLGERRRRIRVALEALPAEQREVIELAFFRGLTQSEIALRTASPLGTVKTRTLLAMKKLRQELLPELEALL